MLKAQIYIGLKIKKMHKKYEKGVKTRMPYRPINFEKIVKYVKSTMLHWLNKKNAQNLKKCRY